MNKLIKSQAKKVGLKFAFKNVHKEPAGSLTWNPLLGGDGSDHHTPLQPLMNPVSHIRVHVIYLKNKIQLRAEQKSWRKHFRYFCWKSSC